MKKNKKIVLIIIAILAIVLSFIGGRAYAKYMSKVTGKATAEVASWSFKVNNNEERMQAVSLKSTANNSKVLNKQMAPGTEGTFEIKIDATNAEVGINYAVKFENETKKPTNLKFKYNHHIYDSLSELQNVLTGSIAADSTTKIKTLEIGWEWKYETGNNTNEILASDIIDTSESKTITDYSFDIIVSGIQINPAAEANTNL